jgi:hypothetical protein
MPALRTERHVFLWKVSAQTVPADAPLNHSVPQILDMLHAAYEEGKAFAFLNSAGRLASGEDEQDIKKCIFIADMKLSNDQSAWCLLINRGDPDVVHPSFMNPRSRSVKNIEPARDEVQAWSAHMVVDVAPQKDGRHRACFEQMPGVSSTLVQTYLDALLSHAAEGDPQFSFTRHLKRGRKVVEVSRPFKLRLEVGKVPSESLKEDVKKGTLREITLHRTNVEYQGPAAPSVVKSVKSELRILTKDVTETAAMAYAQSIIPWAREHGYDEIQFHVTKLPGGTSAHPRFELDKLDALETLYSRSQRITGFREMLSACYEEMHPELAKKMLAIIREDSHW